MTPAPASQGLVPVRVKICGLTNVDDALVAAEAGADALGFVFYPTSPRAVTPEQVAEIIRRLPPYVRTVGVFYNQDEQTIRAVVERCGLDAVQLQGDEPPALCERLGSRVIKAIHMKDRDSLAAMRAYKVRAFLLDTYSPPETGGQPGGTGRTFDWSLAVEAKQYGRVILAGGLTPENVRQAVEQVRPYGVDVSSGVECLPGRKDPEKVKRFITEAKGGP